MLRRWSSLPTFPRNEAMIWLHRITRRQLETLAGIEDVATLLFERKVSQQELKGAPDLPVWIPGRGVHDDSPVQKLAVARVAGLLALGNKLGKLALIEAFDRLEHEVLHRTFSISRAQRLCQRAPDLRDLSRRALARRLGGII